MDPANVGNLANAAGVLVERAERGRAYSDTQGDSRQLGPGRGLELHIPVYRVEMYYAVRTARDAIDLFIRLQPRMSPTALGGGGGGDVLE